MSSYINILILEDNPHDAELIKREVKKGEIEYKSPTYASSSTIKIFFF